MDTSPTHGPRAHARLVCAGAFRRVFVTSRRGRVKLRRGAWRSGLEGGVGDGRIPADTSPSVSRNTLTPAVELTRIHAHACRQAYTHADTCVHTHTHNHMGMHTHTHTHTYSPFLTQKNTHSHVHTDIPVPILCRHEYKYIHSGWKHTNTTTAQPGYSGNAVIRKAYPPHI